MQIIEITLEMIEITLVIIEITLDIIEVTSIFDFSTFVVLLFPGFSESVSPHPRRL